MSTWPSTPNDPLFGALIKTKYAHGRLMRVFYVKRNCDCPTFLSELNRACCGYPKIPPRTTPHMHMISVPADEPHRAEYEDHFCSYYNQIIPFGGGQLADIPENKSWRSKYFIMRIVGRDTGPSGIHQGELFQ